MSQEAPRELTPPPLQAPSAKEKKYDRQLRLWAASGQRALEESHVLLVVGNGSGSNSSVAGVEALKNLILPSIGHFTITDSATVTEEDLGVNFFLEDSSLGKSRAEEATKFLQELNEDVSGHSISEPLTEWLSQQDSLKPYNLILACAPLPQTELEKLSTYALQHSIPFIYIKSIGFYGTASIQLPTEFPIVDTHPDPATVQDIRLLSPWPELQAAEKELADLSQLDAHDHGHVPWLLLLLRFLEEWKQSHADKYPTSFEDKKAFQKYVASQARTDSQEGGEENFDEAVAAVLTSIKAPEIGSGCKALFKMPSCSNLNSESSNFWITANAILQFYAQHGVLPLPGGLPDMKATSSGYIKLQKIYKAKARADIAEITDQVRSTQKEIGHEAKITDEEIELFCKNATYVRVLTNDTAQSIAELRLLNGDTKTLAKIPDMLTGYDTISEVFLAMNVDQIPVEKMTEFGALEDMEGNVLQEKIQKAVEEARRSVGSEMHNTSSVLGGIVAQEAIKLLTRQYVPVNGVAIWDGIRARTEIVQI